MTCALTEDVEQACADVRCEEAIELLERAVWEQSGNYNIYFKLGLCYSGGCRRHTLTSAEIATAYLRQALRLLGPGGGVARAAILDALGNTLASTAGGARVEALREAIGHQEEAACIYSTSGEPDDWARAEFNLGNSCCELAEAADESRYWREAVAHYEEALRVRTREKNPARHAALLENLGSAHRRLDARCSIGYYRRALQIYHHLSDPARHAAIENNIGNAYLALPETDPRTALRNVTRALRHFDRALRIKGQCAITEKNRAQAFSRLARLSPKQAGEM